MKKLISLLVTFLLALSSLLCGCTEHEQPAESSTPAVSKAEGINNATTAQSTDEASEELPEESAAEESAEENVDAEASNAKRESIIAEAEYGRYILYTEEGYGFYETEMTMHDGYMLLADGRKVPLVYESVSHGEDEICSANINGRKHNITSFTDSEERLCQLLECAEDNNDFPITSKIIYYPELEYGIATIGFRIETAEDGFLLSYFDGGSYLLTVSLDEENGNYTVNNVAPDTAE